MVEGRAGAPGPGPGPAAAGGRFELLEHTADVGVRARAPGLEEVFEQATLGLAEVLGAHRPGPGRPEPVEVSAGDLGGLLVDWLNEVLWLREVRQAAIAAVRVERVAGPGGGPGGGAGVADGVARGTVAFAAGGAAADGTFVKAVTYHRLRVEPDPGGGWLAEVYLDV
jgi:SHS2 domain-containing protein